MVWCGAPTLVVVVLKFKFASRFSTLNFSTFLIIKVMLSRLYNDVKRLKARLRLKCNKNQWHSSLNLVSQQLKLCSMERMIHCVWGRSAVDVDPLCLGKSI